MSYPQGYLYQPAGSLALYSCPAYSASALTAPRSDELGRASSGSAFSPYAGSAAFTAPSTGFTNPLQYSTDPATGFPSYMSEDEEEEESGDSERNKEGSLKKKHDQNETSAEDEGISLHVDTLTESSCSPECEGDKVSRVEGSICESGSESKEKCDNCIDDDDAVGGGDDDDDDDGSDEERELSHKTMNSSPLTRVDAALLHVQEDESSGSRTKHSLNSIITSASQTPASKPKLWSLAEIATSDIKQQFGQICSPSPNSSSSTSGSTYPATSILGRPIYYTSPFYTNYTNYANFNHLQSQGILRYSTNETVLNTASLHKQSTDSLKNASPQLEQHFRATNYDSKKDPSDVCTVGVQPYL
ncbi:hypothetical protein chiPu_0003870 [Chiloscyllium punctatum]|uniref:Iroquois-class homeodomain protein domain-containing protein n=1 Tax=Chiloscyllium punctatum TaxID=137246 RepID=A0A401S4Y7_CHIPU|nr:hypothetical protein [Chiloscyllium punctatum]